MRDPKTHAKHLALRQEAVQEALNAAPVGSQRWSRLVVLDSQIGHKRGTHEYGTGWIYLLWASPPFWRHTTIIPDIEEEA